MAILDLTQFLEKTLDIVVPGIENEEDFVTLKINKPDKRTELILTCVIDKQLDIKARVANGEEIDLEEQLEFNNNLNLLIHSIINNNRNGVKFEYSYIDKYFYNTEMVNALLTAYKDWMEKIISDPN